MLERERLAEAGITVLGLSEKTATTSSTYSGTRMYMAPEVVEGRRATIQSDVYALGVLLYQLVVGDLSRSLAPGWRRDVGDKVLCEDIAIAVDGEAAERRPRGVGRAALAHAIVDDPALAHPLARDLRGAQVHRSVFDHLATVEPEGA